MSPACWHREVMTARVPSEHRVLVVEADARVRTALTALIDATPGLRVVAQCARAGEAGDIGRRTLPTVAVVGMCSCPDLSTLTALAEQLPVVAVSPCQRDAERALGAGAVEFCDQDGDADRLSATLLAVARSGEAVADIRSSGRRATPRT